MWKKWEVLYICSFIRAKGCLARIAARVSELIGMDPSGAFGNGEGTEPGECASLLCYWAVRGLGLNVAELSRGSSFSHRV